MFNAKILFLVGLVACLNGQISARLSCKNEQGEDVDWFVLLKPPRESGIAGGAYGYIDNNATGPGWLLAEHDIGDIKSVLGQTFEEVYEKPEKYSYILYNDAKPEGSEGSDSTTYAHAKGALVWNNEDAVWLIHSVPKFLPIFHSKTYEYPIGGKTYAQNFLCISLNSKDNVNEVLKHLTIMRAQVYGNHFRSSLSESLAKDIQDNINILSKKKKSEFELIDETDTITPQDLKKLSIDIESKGGEKFTVISKSKNHLVDIWLAVAQRILKAKEFVVKYWTLLQKQIALLPSQCERTRTLNVKAMEMKFTNDEKTIQWKDNDHSKWGMCTKGGKNCYCAGDMNRATSQFKRGGGVVCIFNKNVHDTFAQTIETNSNCDNEEVEFRN